MVSKVKQASNKHKLVAERAGLVKHQMAIASAAQDELKLRNRSLLDCQQINGALNRVLDRARREHREVCEVYDDNSFALNNHLLAAQKAFKQERYLKRMYMLTATIFIVAEYSPKLYSYIAGLL